LSEKTLTFSEPGLLVVGLEYGFWVQCQW